MTALWALLLLLLGIPKVSAYQEYTGFTLANSKQPVEMVPCIVYKPITLFFSDGVIRTITCESTINNILVEIDRNPRDYEVTYDNYSDYGRDIVLVPVTRERKLEWQKVQFPIEITYTKELPHRKKVIDVRGATGRNGIITEEITYPDGRKKTVIIEKWVEREPKTEHARVGTKYDLQTTMINGKKVSYWGTLSVLATSYDKNCYGCNDITATGAKLRKGVVAVDPRVIPLHTQLYVPGYGFGKALDTGGMIKGNRIDLAYDNIKTGDWSRRWVTIYLID